MVKRSNIHWHLLLLMLIGFFAVAKSEAQVRFEASAPNAVPLDERFQIVFTIQNGYGRDFTAPSFEGLNVLYPPSNAVSRMNVNGKKSMSFTGTFMGKATGKVKIGAASVKVNGKTYHTSPITIEILPQDSPSSSSSSSSSKASRNDIFIRAIPSKTSVYEQEALLVTFKLYSTSRNIGFEEVKFPEFDGFIEENIPMKNTIMLEMEHYKGKNYYTAILKQTLIFPQRAGKLTIPQGEFKMLVSEEPSSISEDSFFDFSVPVQYSLPISSPQLTIDAKPLPEPQPTSFGNAVGKFDLHWDLPEEDFKSNEVATIRLVVKGEGNLKLLSPPKVDFPDSFEVYDPKSNTEIEASTSGVMGTKTFEYNVIPRNKGSFTIPAVVFSYFDPAQSRYITVKAKPLSLKISQGANDGKGRQSDVALLGNDIAYLQPYSSSSSSSDWIRFLSSWYALLPYFLFLILGGGVAVVYVKYRRRRADVVGTKRREAPKRVKKQFKKMEEWITTHESDKVYETLPKVIYSYLADKYSLEQHTMSQKGVCDRLLEKGVSETVVNSLIALLKKSEAASFSDKAHKPSANLLLEEAKEIIYQLENARTRK